MNPEVKLEIQAALTLLRSTCVKNGVGIAYDKRNDNLMFFDIYHYLKCEKYTGLTVKLNDLVK